MRTSPVILLTLSAVSAPLYAAPLRSTACDRAPQLCQSQYGLVARENYDSEAINWAGLAKTAGNALPTIISTIPTVVGWFHNKDSSNSTRRASEELVLRAAANDESGAINLEDLIHYTKVLVPPVLEGVKQLIDEHNNATTQAQRRIFTGIGGTPFYNLAPFLRPILGPDEYLPMPINTSSSSTQHQSAVTIQHRELIEVLARAAAEADESDAFSISNIFKAVKTVIGIGKTVFDGSSNSTARSTQRREFAEVLARAVTEADESDAFSLSSLFGIAKNVFGLGKTIADGSSNNQQQAAQRREFVEVLARAFAEADQSDAFSLSGIFSAVKNVFGFGKALTDSGSTSNDQQQAAQRREFVEILTRAVAEVDESDAFSLSGIFNAVKNVFGLGKTIADGSSSSNNQQQQQRRDDTAELLRRIVGSGPEIFNQCRPVGIVGSLPLHSPTPVEY